MKNPNLNSTSEMLDRDNDKISTKKRAHDSQIVRAKENLKLSHRGSSHR